MFFILRNNYLYRTPTATSPRQVRSKISIELMQRKKKQTESSKKKHCIAVWRTAAHATGIRQRSAPTRAP